MAYRLMLRRALPYTEGTYLLPLEVCKLERDEVTLTPLTLLSGISVTDHLRNGVYQHTTFAMNFTGAPGVVFTIGRNDSAVIKTKLDEARQKIRTAIEAADVAGIEAVATLPEFEDAGYDTAAAVLEECAKLNEGVIAPLNWEGDKAPSWFKDGVVTNRLKNVHKGRTVTSFVNGSQQLFDFVHDNPFIEFHPCDRTNDTAIMSTPSSTNASSLYRSSAVGVARPRRSDGMCNPGRP